MPMETMFEDFYQHMYAVLVANSEITDLVDEENNILPSYDPANVPQGNSIDYGWTGARLDRRNKRGSGLFSIRARSPDDKLVAQNIASKIRATLNARSISRVVGAGLPLVVVHLFNEQLAASDDVEKDQSGKYFVAITYDVRLISVD